MSEAKQSERAETGSLLVVNLRGIVNSRTPVRTTLDQLGIIKRFSATVVPNSRETLGMLQLAKNNVAWCTADAGTIDSLQKRRSKTMPAASANRNSDSQRKESTRHVYRLNSPKGGFKRSIRRQYGQGGILGPNPQLAELVNKML